MTAKIAKNLQAFRIAVNSHDRENPDHSSAYGIGVSAFDLERLGFEDGEELWSGIKIEVDGGQSANFRVLCDGQHDGDAVEVEQDVTRAVGVEA